MAASNAEAAGSSAASTRTWRGNTRAAGTAFFSSSVETRRMEEIQLFLAHAIQLEREAAHGYDELRAMMQSAGNKEVAAFFGEMATFARRHLEDAMQRGGFREIPQMDWREYRWPGGVSPEAPSWEGVDAQMDVQAALLVALAG